MLSGLQLFDSVDEPLRQAERDALAAQDEAMALAARRDQARAIQAEAIRDLARIRAQELRDGGASLGRLDMAEEQVRQALGQRSAASLAAAADVGDRRDAVARAMAERDTLAGTLRALEADQASAMAAAESAARADPEWQRLEATANQARLTAQHAEQKAAYARNDLVAKGKPYMNDPLFAYLWRRGYGTSDYRQGPLSRALDGWVARVADYETARRSYALLAELPEGLTAHAARMSALAEQATAAMVARTRVLAGLPPAADAAAARAALDAAEAKLEAAGAALGEAEARRAALAVDEDALLAKAATRLEAALGQSSLTALREAAARTPTPEDDVIVARLEAAVNEQAAVERSLAQARAAADAARQRLVQVQEIRQEMRQRGYAQDGWNLRDGALIGILINDLLRGTLSRGGFWERMGQYRVPGGGTWGNGPGGNDPWGGGASGGGFGGGGFGGGASGGGFGGGGFKTGGGFGGGGGFKTGGGF